MSQESQAVSDLKAIRRTIVERRRKLASKIAASLPISSSTKSPVDLPDLAAMQSDIEALDRMIADEEQTAPVGEMRSHIDVVSRGPRTDVA